SYSPRQHPSPPTPPEPLEVKPSATWSLRRCVGTLLIRPFDVRVGKLLLHLRHFRRPSRSDHINEPPGMYSRRVGTALHPGTSSKLAERSQQRHTNAEANTASAS